MAFGQKLDTKSSALAPSGPAWPRLGASCGSTRTPARMDTTVTSATGPTMTLPELAAFMSVSVQALYDLRSKGRGPRGFRVGRQLRFRLSEIEAWIAEMEAQDARRHPPRSRP